MTLAEPVPAADPGTAVPVRWHVAVVVLAVAAAGLVLTANHRFGVGLTHDSVHYISAARSLASGEGLLGFDGELLVDFPPLFSALLAAPGAFGLDPVVTARFLNALVFGVIVFVAGQLMLRQFRSRLLAVVGTAAVLTAFPLITVSVMAWTEPLFALFILLLAWLLARFAVSGRRSFFVAACVLAALACLLRYAGVFVVASSALALLAIMRGASLRRRFGHALVLALTAAVPLAAWLLHNSLTRGTFAGPRPEPFFTFWQSMVVSSEAVLEWYVPWLVAQWLKWGSLLVVLPTTAGIALLVGRRLRDEADTAVRFQSVCLLVLLVYGAALSFLTLRMGIGPFTRMLAPFSTLSLLVVFGVLDHTAARLGERWRRPRLASGLAALLGLLWLAYPVTRLAWVMPKWLEHGVGVYDATEWRELSIVEWLKQNPLEGRLLSNDPGMVYLLTGTRTTLSPRRTDDIARLAAEGRLRPGDRLVWFSRVKRPYLYTVPELAEMLPLEEEVFVGDGGVLVIGQAGG
jgi:4-amino-4-deoxy-L-arabinose transferase-like glycosyltransferase